MKEEINDLHLFIDNGESLRWETVTDSFRQRSRWVDNETGKIFNIYPQKLKLFTPNFLSIEWIHEKIPKFFRKFRVHCVDHNFSCEYTIDESKIDEKFIEPDGFNSFPYSDIDASMLRQCAYTSLLRKGMLESFKRKLANTNIPWKKVIIIIIVVAVIGIILYFVSQGQQAPKIPVSNTTRTPIPFRTISP